MLSKGHEAGNLQNLDSNSSVCDAKAHPGNCQLPCGKSSSLLKLIRASLSSVKWDKTLPWLTVFVRTEKVINVKYLFIIMTGTLDVSVQASSYSYYRRRPPPPHHLYSLPREGYVQTTMAAQRHGQSFSPRRQSKAVCGQVEVLSKSELDLEKRMVPWRFEIQRAFRQKKQQE